MHKATLLVLALCLVALTLGLMTPNDVDKEAVQNAVLDYVEGIYNAQPDRIARSVDVTLRKYGFGRGSDKKEYYPAREMNYKQLYSLAAKWNLDRHVDPETAPKEVTIFEVTDKTASAKVAASWGIDYFHLAKEDGTWRIVNVIWQSYPPEKKLH